MAAQVIGFQLKLKAMKGIYFLGFVFLVLMTMKASSRFLLIEIEKGDGAKEVTQSDTDGSRKGKLKSKDLRS